MVLYRRIFSGSSLLLDKKCSYLKSYLFAIFHNKSVYKNEQNLPIIVSSNTFHYSATQNIHLSYVVTKKEFNPYATELEKRKKIYTSALILLLESNDKLTTMSLDSAMKLAKRHEKKLVKVEDPHRITKSKKEIYQLMDPNEFHQKRIISSQLAKEEAKKSIKGVKTLELNSLINSRDLEYRYMAVQKWLEKRFQIKIHISNTSSQGKVDILKYFQERAKEMNFNLHSINVKGNSTTFYINPFINKEEKKKVTSNQQDTAEAKEGAGEDDDSFVNQDASAKIEKE